MIGKHRIGGGSKDDIFGRPWSWSKLDEQSPMGLGVIRCNDAEVMMDLEDLAERRINNLHAFNKRRGSESLSLRHTFHSDSSEEIVG